MSHIGSHLALADFVRYLSPEMVGDNEVHLPTWPGDVFAVCAAVIEKAGAYSSLGTIAWPSRQSSTHWKSLDERTLRIQALASQWRRNWPRVPKQVEKWWQSAFGDPNLRLLDINSGGHRLCDLFNLLAVADESLAGVGLGSLERAADEPREYKFWAHAETLLSPYSMLGNRGDDLEGWEAPGFNSSLCEAIHTSRVRVLPKSQTPSNGLSLRSLSHHLSFCPPADLQIGWSAYGVEPALVRREHLNALLIPWPFEVEPSQFRPIDISGSHIPSGVGWFRFSPRETQLGRITAIVENLVSSAEGTVGDIHLVVMPELALSTSQYQAVRNALDARGIILVSGVAEESDSGGLGANYAAMSIPSRTVPPVLEFWQRKHHRWRLDKDQIIRYDLSSSLLPARLWWEGIDVSERTINFVRIRNWLSACVLICEDLARIDPVGRLVRTVAPDLVIALLLDGPQLKGRWPANYATVLADDPGSSVLTLTSLGMTQLSRMQDRLGSPVPRVIALWRDPVSGPIEIELPAGKHAAVLSLCRQETEEFSADGRPHTLSLGAPVFAGIHFLASSVT
jgi:hypothetical protein